MNKLEVTITKEDFANASRFQNGNSCPLTMAMKRTFNTDNAYSRGYSKVGLDNKTYLISGFSENLGLTDENGFTEKIDNYIIAAKAGEDVPEYNVVLTEMVQVEETY